MVSKKVPDIGSLLHAPYATCLIKGSCWAGVGRDDLVPYIVGDRDIFE